MRGKDSALLDLPPVQARLAWPPDEQTTPAETGTCRALFDCPDRQLSPAGPRLRVIVATHPATTSEAKLGTTGGETVYELFSTALPVGAFRAAEVAALSLPRGAFECVLGDDDQEPDPDRWCSHSACGQEFWPILAQGVWHLRLELGHELHPLPLRTTEFAPAPPSSPEPFVEPAPVSQPTAPVESAPPHWARPSVTGGLPGSAGLPPADGTRRGPAHPPLSPQERRAERDGSLRVLEAARLSWPLSPLCAACAVSSSGDHPQSATGQCRLWASLLPEGLLRCFPTLTRASFLSLGSSCDPLERLATLLAAAGGAEAPYTSARGYPGG